MVWCRIMAYEEMGSGEKREWRRFTGSLPSFLANMAYASLIIFVQKSYIQYFNNLIYLKFNI